MDKERNLLEFISFCIEMYAARGSLSGRAVHSLFERSGVLDYLERNYEPLHTQGFNYILPCIDDFLTARRTDETLPR